MSTVYEILSKNVSKGTRVASYVFEMTCRTDKRISSKHEMVIPEWYYPRFGSKLQLTDDKQVTIKNDATTIHPQLMTMLQVKYSSQFDKETFLSNPKQCQLFLTKINNEKIVAESEYDLKQIMKKFETCIENLYKQTKEAQNDEKYHITLEYIDNSKFEEKVK